MKRILLFATIFFSLTNYAQLRLVKDICPNCNSSPASFYEFNGKLYFTALNVGSGGERKIYSTDGTDVGTTLLHFNNDNTGPDAINTFGTVLFYNLNGELYLDAKDGSTNSMKIVKLTNGTTIVNTVYDMSLASGSNDSRFGFATAINNKIVYSPITTSNATGLEPHVLNVSSPSSSGLLKDIYFNPSTSASNPENFTVYNDTIYFSATNQITGRELYKTDGTTIKTSIYYDINPSIANSDPDELNVIGSNLVFIATNATYGRELFRINGLGNYALVKDIKPGTASSSPINSVKIDDVLYFSADDGTNGYELWKSDGTANGTVMIKDITAGAGNSFPKFFTKVGADIYFVANTNEIWKTNGTDAGTVFVKDISTVGTYGVNNLVAYNGKLYFILFTTNSQSEFWVSDGTDAGTIRLLTGDKRARNLYLYNNEIYMSAYIANPTFVELYAYMDPALANADFQLNNMAISLYPNPSKNYFELASEVVIEKVAVYSMLGQLVKSFDPQNQYAVSDLSKGTYIVKISTVEGTTNKTLIIE